MVKYSAKTDNKLIAKLTRIATRVEPASRRAMANGPASLQVKSMRRICELRAGSIVSLLCWKKNSWSMTDLSGIPCYPGQ